MGGLTEVDAALEAIANSLAPTAAAPTIAEASSARKSRKQRKGEAAHAAATAVPSTVTAKPTEARRRKALSVAPCSINADPRSNEEVKRMPAIMANKAFKANPFEAIRAHAANTLPARR